jgi:hypothetical protein
MYFTGFTKISLDLIQNQFHSVHTLTSHSVHTLTSHSVHTLTSHLLRGEFLLGYTLQILNLKTIINIHSNRTSCKISFALLLIVKHSYFFETVYLFQILHSLKATNEVLWHISTWHKITAELKFLTNSVSHMARLTCGTNGQSELL